MAKKQSKNTKRTSAPTVQRISKEEFNKLRKRSIRNKVIAGVCTFIVGAGVGAGAYYGISDCWLNNDVPTPPPIVDTVPSENQATYAVNNIKLSAEELGKYDILSTLPEGSVENITKDNHKFNITVIDSKKSNLTNITFANPNLYDGTFFVDLVKLFKDNRIEISELSNFTIYEGRLKAPSSDYQFGIVPLEELKETFKEFSNLSIQNPLFMFGFMKREISDYDINFSIVI